MTVLTKHGYVGDLESSENLRKVVTKLPRELKRDWAEHIMSMEPDRPTLVDLEKWLEKQVRIALNFAAVSDEKMQPQRRQANVKVQSSPVKRTLLASTVVSCTLCAKEHKLWQCDTFRDMAVDDRAQFIASNNCCFSCLQKGHRAAQCRFRKTCPESGCKMNHHRLLHGSRKVSLPRTEVRDSRDEVPLRRAVTSTACRRKEVGKTTLLQVVPVKILGADGKSVTTCALLDPGAQTTLCTKGLADQLGIEGVQERLQLQTVQGPAAAQLLWKVPLKLLPIDGQSSIDVDEAYTVDDLNIHVPFVDKKQKKRWPHISDLPIYDCSDMEVGLLLGANVLEAVIQEEVRRGRPGEPVAIKTAFGWTLTGTIADLVPEETRQVMFLNKEVETDEIRAEMKTWWETECFATKYNDEVSLSAEDRRAVSSLEANTKKTEDGRYETGLLWKNDDVSLPDNRSAALQRLKNTERSLRKNEQKAKEYGDVLMGYVAKGHAKILTPAEVAEKNKRQWILPHHGVVNPSKDKMRIVFDAAAAYRGVSLNDCLMSGPDLLQNLAGVLIRFREEKVAIMADIEEMFHRVLIRDEDQPALRFYWRDMDVSRPPDVYQMGVAVFGAKCSPAIANYVLHKAADDSLEDSEDLAEAAQTIKRNFYMDDMAKSVPDVESAAALGKQVSQILLNGGFRLTKWSSNEPQALTWVPAADRAIKVVDFSSLASDSVKALGCSWSPASDLISIQSQEQEVAMTKRGMLKCTASIFDPLGIVSPFVVRAKLLLQRLWSMNFDWDQPLEGDVLHAWEAWLSERRSLMSIKTPRCYKADLRDPVSRAELHVFGDASQDAFAAVAYLRQVSSDGQVSCSLVMSRTRNAPLKQISIVRLEVQAAVLAVRLGRTLQREISTPLDAVYYWTDSKAVLHYIRNESKRFHTFVANRVAEIRSDSDVGEWRHVPGLLNPADLGSRGCSARDLLISDLWWKGPAFLAEGADHWPDAEICDDPLDEADPEVKVTRSVLATVTQTQRTLPDPGRFSSWLKYRRTVAWMLRFLHNVRRRRICADGVHAGPLQADELQAAEIIIIKERQRLCYGEELHHMQAGLALADSSRLKSLSPFIDGDGMVRARGRIGDAPIPYDTRHPIILEGSDPVTMLVIQDAHKTAMHAGMEHTLSAVRSRFWIQRGRTFVKRVLKRCKICHKRRVRPEPPLMASLPQERLEDTRPFNNVGIDYLGPLYVRKFRRTEKRYALLITCLSTRAVHLEVSYTLDTDSLLMSLRRFFSRRGTPSVIWSDNGSSFVAGKKELAQSFLSVDQDRMLDAMTKHHIKWVFNPPAAPHMGGSWERLVAAVKRPLRVVLGPSVVDDEVLQTVLCEVEFMVNSRPITYISSEADDFSPLTPNHFLLGYPYRGLPPSTVTSSDAIGKRKWRHACSLADHLWQRWKREYLPTLLPREKWTKESSAPSEDDVVLIVDDDLPRGQWRLGKVLETYPGRDGVVRSVLLKTSSGRELVRPVTKLCRLEKAQ